MHIIDVLIIFYVIFALIIGMLAGYSRLIKFIGKGITGFIFKLLISYGLAGVLLKIEPIGNFAADIRGKLVGGNGFLQFLAKIRIDLIAIIIVMFIVVTLIMLLLRGIGKSFENGKYGKITPVNRVFGMILSVAFFGFLLVLFFHVSALIEASTGSEFIVSKLLHAGSMFKMDELYLQNPINTLFIYFAK